MLLFYGAALPDYWGTPSLCYLILFHINGPLPYILILQSFQINHVFATVSLGLTFALIEWPVLYLNHKGDTLITSVWVGVAKQLEAEYNYVSELDFSFFF